MKGLKDFHSAKADLDGIETAHMIRKAQLGENGIPAYQQFLALAR
jgi:putative transposase